MGNILRKKLKTRPGHVKCTIVISYANEISKKKRRPEPEIEEKSSFQNTHFVPPPAQPQSLDINAPAGRIILNMEESYAKYEDIFSDDFYESNYEFAEDFIGESKYEPTENFMGETKKNSVASPRRGIDWSTVYQI